MSMHMLRARSIRAAVLALCAALLVAAPLASANDHRKDPWQGKPEIDKGETRGYFVWSDGSGWHVRWMSRGKKHTYSGSVTSDAALSGFEAVSKDSKDFIKQEGDKTIRFDARAKEGMDGFNFRPSPSSKTITFDLNIDGSRAGADDVKLGKDRAHPKSLPFTINR
jgi:hypothetical protein